MSKNVTHAIIQAQQKRRSSIPVLLQKNRPYYEKLLRDAKGCVHSGEYPMAVILAQAASELCTESALRDLLSTKGVGELVRPLSGLFVSRSLTNEKLRKIFDALSGTTIGSEAFWQSYTKHYELRNDIAHEGKACTKSQAEASVEAVSKLIKYVQQTVKDVRTKK